MEDILILFILLLLSAFFSGSETAMTAISVVRVESLLKDGRSGAYALSKLKNNTDRMLITILIGNNLVNIAASAMATITATEMFGHFGPGLAVGGLTLVILIFGEITPKTFAARHAAAIALFVAPPLYMFGKIVMPLVWVLELFTGWLHSFADANTEPTVTESELISLAQHSADEGGIEEDEQRMIQRVLEFDNLCAEDIMIPRHKIIALDGNTSLREALPDIINQNHSRIPLHNGHLENISKVINLRDVLTKLAQNNLDITLFECGFDPIFVPENYPLNDALLRLQVQKNQLILVVDDLGVLQGMLTLEDMLEELVGEIYDTKEKPASQLIELKNEELRVNGALEIRLLEEYFKQDLSGKPTDSVNQWILNEIGHIPSARERVIMDGLTVDVEKASPRAIDTVRIGRIK
jgi:putative hemolysin